MNVKATWSGLLAILLVGLVAGVLNTLLFMYVMHPLLASAKEDEVAVSTYAINLFVGWVFFSAWFLARADDEVKKVEEAVHRHDKHTFLIEAPKQIPLSVRVLYLAISILTVLSFHLFFLQSQIVTIEIQFGIGFLVVTTALMLWDLDNPLSGAVSVAHIPAEWLAELQSGQKPDSHPLPAEKIGETIEA